MRKTRRWTSSMPSLSTTHLRRARSLLSRLPVCSNTRSTDSMVGSRSSLAVKSSRASAGWGLAPRPPAMNTRKPCSMVPSSSVRVVAITPTSLNMAWPQSVSQPEKLILNLRGRRWANGWRRKCWKAASAHGLMSKASNGQAPARWQPITLRTVSPQASRVVRPTEARRRMTSGMLLELDEVELDVLPGGDVAPAPRVGLGDVGQHVELLGGDRAVGHLDPHHLVVAALALAVDAVVQPEHPEDVLGEVAVEVAGRAAPRTWRCPPLASMSISRCSMPGLGGAWGIDVENRPNRSGIPPSVAIPDRIAQQCPSRHGWRQ